MRRFRRAISWYGYVIIHILPAPLVSVRYEDRSRAGEPGPHVFVCNHRSTSDPFLMACLPHECVQVVNDWPMRLPALGPIARLAGYLSIKEMTVDEFLARAGRLLQEGTSIIAFPEGTRSRALDVGTFHGTVFRLALQARVPLVPICITGNERTPTPGSPWLHPARITLRRLPALLWDEYKDLSPFQLKQRVRDIIALELTGMEAH